MMTKFLLNVMTITQAIQQDLLPILLKQQCENNAYFEHVCLKYMGNVFKKQHSNEDVKKIDI